MLSTGSHTSPVVQLRISHDRIRAELELSPGYIRNAKLLLEQIIQAIEQTGIPRTTELLNRAEKIAIDAARCAESSPHTVLLALGDPACEAVDGDFDWCADLRSRLEGWRGDASVNYYDPKSVLTIPAGANIGRILPPRVGKVGRDVFGNEIPPRRIAGRPLQIGAGLEMRNTGDVWSTAGGRVAVVESTICVMPLMDVPRDVDIETGNVITDLDVQVRGVVKAGFSVHTARSLAVEGAVENGSIVAGGDLSVRGGIYGGLHGTVQVGGTLVAAIADNADLQVDGDIRICHELVNCRAHAHRALRIEFGAVAGGVVHARNGVWAGTLGAASGTPTRVSIGPTALELARIADLEREMRELRKQSFETRTGLQSLVANMRHITPLQRERASELLRHLGELEAASQALRERRTELLRSALPDPKLPAEIRVERRLYPGVCVAIGARESTIRHRYDGPLRIHEREFSGRTAIVLFSEATNSLTILQTQAVSQPAPAHAP